MIISLVTLSSTTHKATISTEGQGVLLKQGFFFLIFFIIFFATSYSNYKKWLAPSAILYLIFLVLLILTQLQDYKIASTSRWLVIGEGRLQPSEFMKPILIIITSHLIYLRSRLAQDKHYFLNVIILFFIPTLLTFIQPDLGTTMVLILLCLSMLFISGINWQPFILLIIFSLSMAPLSWNFLEDYQKDRLITFVDPTIDPQNTGYNVWQSMTAFGAGGLIGKGLGQGTQTQLKFLPVRHTDFIYSVIGEELGLLGALTTLSLYFIILYRCLIIAEKADNLGRYITLGIFSFLSIQIFINIGMNIGIMPITGLPLPLVSYGGSFVLTTAFALGAVQSVALHSNSLQKDTYQIYSIHHDKLFLKRIYNY